MKNMKNVKDWALFLAGLFGPPMVGWFLWKAGAGTAIALVMIFLLWFAEAVFFINGFTRGGENTTCRYEEEIIPRYERRLMAMWAEKNRIPPLAAHCRRPVNLGWAKAEEESDDAFAPPPVPTPKKWIN